MRSKLLNVARSTMPHPLGEEAVQFWCSCGAVPVQFPSTPSFVEATTQAADQRKPAPDRRQGAHSD